MMDLKETLEGLTRNTLQEMLSAKALVKNGMKTLVLSFLATEKDEDTRAFMLGALRDAVEELKVDLGVTEEMIEKVEKEIQDDIDKASKKE